MIIKLLQKLKQVDRQYNYENLRTDRKKNLIIRQG